MVLALVMVLCEDNSREEEENTNTEVEDVPSSLAQFDVAAAPPATSTPPEPEPEINPIASTIERNRSGWASFFSSRTLLVKTLGYGVGGGAIEDVKRDENGMEIMDLDLDDESEAGPQHERGRGGETKDVGDPGVDVKVKAVGRPTPNIQPALGLRSLTIKPSHSNLAGGGNLDNMGSGDVTAAKHLASGANLSKAAPPLTISPAVKKETTAGVNAKRLAAGVSSSASSTPRRGNSGTNTPVPPSPSSSDSSKPSVVPNATSVTVIDKSKSSSTGSSSTSTITTTTTTKKTAATTIKRTASPTPSKKSVSASPPPNLVLPTWQDTFHMAPRNVLPPKPETYVDDQGVGGKLLGKTMKFVNTVLFAKDVPAPTAAGGINRSTSRLSKGKERAREGSVVRDGDGSGGESLLERDRRERFREWGKELPKSWRVLEEGGVDTSEMGLGLGGRYGPGGGKPAAKRASVKALASELPEMQDVLRGCKRVVVIGVHGWFPGTMIRTVLGEPTGTSSKFANMMEQALQEFEKEHDVKLEKITKIPLEGDGTIEKRVERLYGNLKANEQWMSDLHDADAILVATHSQGSVVSTHLLDQLIKDNHIVTSRNQTMPMGTGAEAFPSAIGVGDTVRRKVQRVCCLALCGIHLGPLRYLSSSTLVGPYLQYFESTAARELFEFQNTESAVSKAYVASLQNVLDHGTKILYIASLNDQVVPIYSGLFTVVSHPLILRALYIDGDAYHSSDFLSNLLVLLLRILNSGMSDSGLLAHLSEATAGSLNGVGHSTAYEEIATYSLAVKYLFLANEGMTDHTKLVVEPFNASHEQNDYEIPWSLRDIIADERVRHFFSRDISELRDAFREWHPKTAILRDLKRKLQPIQRLPSNFSTGSEASSKL
ncbi:hypothetical protein BDZ97DRAFT_213140 [Flammula alnicola]|nr:hypothetical protein BDZ97DRAFT_213140 [Flammula alnicola]